jgi:hypothetical protein
MLCEEKDKLVAEYNKAALDHSRLVSVLNKRRARATKAEYERMRRDADVVSVKSKEARLALKRHTTEHGCRD